jgi:hypothetical protein
MGATLGGFDEGVFDFAPTLIHLAARDLFRGCADEAQFAYGQVVVLVADGRAEGATLHGASGVQVAGAGDGVEDRAGLIVRELVEGCGVVRLGEENARAGVAGEAGCEALARGGGARTDAVCNGWIDSCEGDAKFCGIERRDFKDADAAGVATGTAGQPSAGSGDGGGKGDIEDGEEIGHEISVRALLRDFESRAVKVNTTFHRRMWSNRVNPWNITRHP